MAIYQGKCNFLINAPIISQNRRLPYKKERLSFQPQSSLAETLATMVAQGKHPAQSRG